MRLPLLLLLLALTGVLTDAYAQSGISFNTSQLTGAQLTHPTTLSFGPDNRLYVATQAGEIRALTIRKNGPNNYEVTNTEIILLVKNLPNRDDRAGLVASVTERQITGILAAGTEANPVLYVNSSDPRIGGGGELGDQDLDTNSGTLSKLTKSNGIWTMVHTVRGMPRSEENHAPNGMALDPVTNILYIAQGGNTNAGSPSNNFGYLTEYALSGAVLSIDLNMINNQFGGAYTLPTLDDPTRPNMPDGSDVNDPWGGNDGLNQAKLVPGGPVQIYSPGYRNIYDVTITKSVGRAGRMYTVDNGANGGWGGFPVNEGTPNVTNDRIFSEPGSTSPTANDDKVNNLDNLHFITGKGYYGGHPNPIRANPAGAGLYWFDNATSTGHFELNPTVDWPPVPVSMANPVESDFRNPGVNDGALWVTPHSTNGLVEYSASNFNGALRGNLLAASSMSNEIMRIQLNAAGDQVTNVSPLFSGFGEFPLDLLAQGDGDIHPGTIWTVIYNAGRVVIFEPTGSAINCSGDVNNFNRDDDADGYSNGDETLNGTDPCSPASKPADYDNDLVSNLSDPDDDNDGQSDIVDKFAVDASNGMNTVLPLDYPFLNGVPGTGLFGVGVTGLMTNGVDNYEAQYDPEDQLLIVGGAVGAFSVPASPGDPTTNNQKYAFQFGIPISASIGQFTMQGRLLGSPFFDGATGGGLGTQFQGIYFGNGDQNNYFKFGLHANNGNPGFQILCEQNGVVVNQQIIPIANILGGSQIDIFIDVDVVTGVVQCRYQTTNGTSTVVGQSFTVSGNLLSLLQAHTNAVAIGIIASAGNKATFSATWDFMRITTSGVGQYQWQSVNYANGTSPSARHENAFVEVGGKFYLLGGRGIKNVGIYNPATKIWTAGAQSPIELHHFQAIAYQNKIYVIGALTGPYPSETPVANIYIYDVATNGWSTGATIPAARRRGSSGVVQFNNKFYVIAGTQNGHSGGFVNWVDSYDPATNAWATLADAPEARDHFQAAITNGKIYCIGGRRTTQPDFAGNTVSAVNVYDIASNTWTSPTQIPTPRAGHSVALVNNEIIATGGEVNYQTDALNTVEAYNVTNNTWTTRPQLNVGRHATQLIYFGGSLYLAAGSSTQASTGENNTMAFAEFPSTNTAPTVVQAYPNQTVPSTQTSLAVPLITIFADNGGVANLTYTVPSNSNPALVNSTQINN
ncbi:MAG: kelch repeat-containing protein, partial [Chryseolinea sp.]